MKTRWITLSVLAALLLAMLMLAGCVMPTPQVIEIEKPVTVVVIATPTPIPTNTPSPTPTQTTLPTDTPSPMPSKPTPLPSPTPSPTRLPESSIVLVKATNPLYEEIEQGPIVGTGIIYSKEGLILTAAHVIEGASKIKVEGPGWDHPLSARLKGINPCQDLAVLEITEEGGPFVPAVLGSSEKIRPGDRVRAYGYPDNAERGDDYTVTEGIVSRVGDVGTISNGLTFYDLIKTDARISGGNSGGPLVAWEGPEKGKVIGIVQLGKKGDRAVGWATPVDKRIKTIKKLAGGKKEYWLGAALVPPLVIYVYPGGPADKIGLEVGDVLFEMKDIEVDSMDTVCDIMESSQGPIPITVARFDPEVFLRILLKLILDEEISEEELEELVQTATILKGEIGGESLAPVKELFGAKVRAEALNVREGPGTEYLKIAVVEWGDRLVVLGRNPACTWLKVRTPQDDVGWVSRRYVDLFEDCDGFPIAEAPPPPSVASITVINDKFGSLQLTLDGPISYEWGFEPFESRTVKVRHGRYQFKGNGSCGFLSVQEWTIEGTVTIAEAGAWRWWCDGTQLKTELR